MDVFRYQNAIAPHFRDTQQPGNALRHFHVGVALFAKGGSSNRKPLSESPMAVIETILLTPLLERFKLNP